MRASPTFEVTLRQFGVWRSAVLTLSTLGLSALIGWTLTRHVTLDAGVLTAVAASCVALIYLAISLVRVPAAHLRWDGSLWHVDSVGQGGGSSVSGNVSVAIDLGAWMLLRFQPAPGASRRHVKWLPAQRRGIEIQWHGLRCSVYSPRPAVQTDTSMGP